MNDKNDWKQKNKIKNRNKQNAKWNDITKNDNHDPNRDNHDYQLNFNMNKRNKKIKGIRSVATRKFDKKLSNTDKKNQNSDNNKRS